MKEMIKDCIKKFLFYICYLMICTITAFIPLYAMGMFIGVVSLLAGFNFTISTIAKVSFFISTVISLYAMWSRNAEVEICYEKIRNREK